MRLPVLFLPWVIQYLYRNFWRRNWVPAWQKNLCTNSFIRPFPVIRLDIWSFNCLIYQRVSLSLVLNQLPRTTVNLLWGAIVKLTPCKIDSNFLWSQPAAFRWPLKKSIFLGLLLSFSNCSKIDRPTHSAYTLTFFQLSENLIFWRSLTTFATAVFLFCTTTSSLFTKLSIFRYMCICLSQAGPSHHFEFTSSDSVHPRDGRSTDSYP